MKYNIRGDKLLVTKAIKNYIEEKLGKLDKYFKNKDLKANVLIKTRGNIKEIVLTLLLKDK